MFHTVSHEYKGYTRGTPAIGSSVSSWVRPTHLQISPGTCLALLQQMLYSAIHFLWRTGCWLSKNCHMTLRVMLFQPRVPTFPLFAIYHSARMHTKSYNTCLSVCACASVTTFSATVHYAQENGQRAMPTGSVLHWLDFKTGDFYKSIYTAFKSYGVLYEIRVQYAN